MTNCNVPDKGSDTIIYSMSGDFSLHMTIILCILDFKNYTVSCFIWFLFKLLVIENYFHF